MEDEVQSAGGTDIKPISDLAFPVVGLGASAGGIPALLAFFHNVPADVGMAFVVVLHLSPNYKSDAVPILQKATALPVVQVQDREPQPIQANHVYVVPPMRLLSMVDGCLSLAFAERPHGPQVIIDIFFRTLADAHKERAMAVVLSGLGSDGAVGLASIKEQGGITFAQAPSDAEFASMPATAIDTGMVDFILPAAEIPKKLISIWENAKNIRLPQESGQLIVPVVLPPDQAARVTEEALHEIISLLRARTGHDFTHYKRATVLRRIERRLQINRLSDIPSYRDFLREHPYETAALLDDLLIGVTNFFRDSEAFEALQREAIQALLLEKEGDDPIRVWVPACATGEEAYSIAMLLREQIENIAPSRRMQIFATDIDETAIAVGRNGLYPHSIATDVSPDRLRRFFIDEKTQYCIKKEIRENVLFAVHNILRDPPFSKLDLISCRNLLIYLDGQIHREILQIFHFALRPSGFLFLGNSETADSAPKLFSPVDKKHRIYRASVMAHTGPGGPNFPLGRAQRKPIPRVIPMTERRKDSLSDVHQRLVEQYAPPSVLVDRSFEILHLSEHAGRFLNFVGGEPSHNLLTVVQPELRLELRAALFEALQNQKSIEARRVQITRDGRGFYVNMIVQPVQENIDSGQVILVLFNEVEDTLSPDARAPQDADRDPVVVQLEAEVQALRERLQNTVEQYETSTEELKVTNEELQAANEELRSTSEELETSKEELQSINEELITVNQELKMKVDETAQINNDLQNLITSTDIATIFVDRNMRIKRFTPQAMKIFNIIESDIGLSLLDITHRLDYEHLAEDAAEVFESLRTREQEVASTNGRWYLARLLPYRTTEDRIDGAVLTFIDITSRRLAEERLRSDEDRLRLAVESTNDYAILTVDTDGIITSWNKGAERVFGWTEAEALGQPTAMLFLPEDRADGAHEEELRVARQRGRADDERWHQRKDGSRIYCSGVMTPLKQGEGAGFVKIARDLTYHKYGELEREALLRHEKDVRTKAQAANKLKDEFLAIMSHELKNPLNLIQVNAELLSRLPEVKSVPTVQRSADIIKRAVMTQAQIIDDLLDLSRLRTGKLLLSCSPIKLNELVENIVEFIDKDASSKQVKLTREVPPEPVVIYADPVRVEQILWNVLGNSLKFTRPGDSITVRLTTRDKGAQLEVTDTGLGISPDVLPHIFDMFKQDDTRSSPRHGGLGIGLGLVRQLTELHGGHVSADSAGRLQGTSIKIWFPLHTEDMSKLPGESQTPSNILAGKRLLLVDDTAEATQGLVDLLKLEQVDVTHANSAAEALRLAQDRDFDLVLCDVDIATDDYRVWDELLKLPHLASVPVIPMTVRTHPKELRKLFDAGFTNYVSKPIVIEKLLEAASQAFNAKQMQ